MKLIFYLFKRCRKDIVAVAALGLAGGLSSAALIAVINRVVHPNGTFRYIVAAFVAIAIVKIGCALGSSLLLVRLSQNSVFQLCEDLCNRIIDAPFRQTEVIGTGRLLALLTDDVATLAAAIQAIPPMAVNFAILGGCTAYLVWLSWKGALVLLAFVGIGTFCYKILLVRAHEAIRRAREERDTLFRHFRALTDGLKELKLNRDRRETFLGEDIGSAIERLRKQGLIAANQYVIADGWNQTMFYMVMGAMLFVLPGQLHVSNEALTAYVFAALYAAAPIWSLIGVIPVFDRGREALERLQTVGLSITPEQTPAFTRVQQDYFEIELSRVEFKYGTEDRGFTLGPLDLSLQPGELVFVIGGNGSGKSTFVKLLTGLYTPQAGEIRLNGVLLAPENQEDYRQLFSVVYSDFFLFDRLPGIKSPELQEAALAYLETLQLSHKVRLDGDRLSTTSLSQGQRRRLALLSAYLEDRPIFVLDEWAADQDPGYREIFYTRLLPELKRRGKTVVVVTHDDRYFHLGDRLLKLDYGGIVEKWERPAKQQNVLAQEL